MFDAIGIAGSGLDTYKTWIDALSDNVANVNTARPMSSPAFQERFIVAQSVEGGADNVGEGVAVTSVALGNPQGRVVYDPGNPLANAQGLVRLPDINLSDQMTALIIAQRAYQANAAVITRAQTAYQAALNIGKPT